MASLDFRPVVTYNGDHELFKNFQPEFEQGLKSEKAEWRRSYGRPPKSVILNAKFNQFDEDQGTTSIQIRNQSILHTYWVSCTDTEQYKATVKDDVQSWLTQVKAKEYTDWLIICFETADPAKKTTKLIPRTSVLERIKSELAGKNADHCLAICEPNKNDSGKLSEVWINFIHKLRFFLMTSFNKMVLKFEEYARSQRERRNESSWDFRDYFLLQDELGLLFQTMGMMEESLLVYDELEAMFAQFIQDISPNSSPQWLNSFKAPPESWSEPRLSTPKFETSGVNILSSSNYQHRNTVRNKTCSLLDFRNYLFAQQSSFLVISQKAVELARRYLAMMHSCLAEVKLLGLNPVPGSVAAWVVLTTLDGVRSCTQVCPEMEAGDLARYTAAMWNLAKFKLLDLGISCGLHPKNIVESEQLHYLATLSSGFTSHESSSVAALQQALASTDNFRKLYLNFCEMAISGYKHVSLARSARLVGKDLAKFYDEIGESQKAVQFLADLLRSYEDEAWDFLKAEIQKDLAGLYQKVGGKEKAVLMCAKLVESSRALTSKSEWLQVLLQESEGLSAPVYVSDLVTDVSVKFSSQQLKIINKQSLSFDFSLSLDALIPASVSFDSVRVILKEIGENHYFQNSPGAAPSEAKALLTRTASDRNFNLVTDLSIKELVSYKQDGSVSSVGVTCLNPQKLYIFPKPTQGDGRDDVSSGKVEITNHDVVLNSGRNELLVKGEVSEKGSYVLSKVEFVKGNLILQHRVMESKANVVTVSDDKLAILAKPKRKCGLLAGFTQEVSLIVHSGSFTFSKPFVVTLRSSHGMKVGLTPEKEELTTDLEVEFPSLDARQSSETTLWVYTDILQQKETVIHHKLTVQVPQLENGVFAEILVDFSLPFSSNFKLHVVQRTKFLNFNIHGLTTNEDEVELANPNLTVRPLNGEPLKLNFLNVGAESLKVFHEFNAAYLWEMKDYPANLKILKGEFSVDYRMKDGVWLNYKYSVDISDFHTILALKGQVIPLKGAEYCRAGSVCSLVITIDPYAADGGIEAIMYEVLQEPNMWAVCGRTAGVMNLEGKSQQVTVEVMPLIGGYLPLPSIRLSKYIPSKSGDIGSQGLPRLEPFGPGQVYSASKSLQVHVLAASSLNPDQSLL